MGRFVSGDSVIDSGNNNAVSFGDILNKPTTLAGYGITDGAVATNIPFSTLVNKPTTLVGYGITDGVTDTELASAIDTAIASLVLDGTNLALKANIASPIFTGVPAAPTAAVGTNTTQLATTAFVKAETALKANIASPSLTGTPLAPTAVAGTNTTQIATTAFVNAAVIAGGGGGGGGGALTIVNVTTTAQAAVTDNHYVLKNVATSTVTLPATPVESDIIQVTAANGLKTNIIDGNGKTIMGSLEDFILDIISISPKLQFINNDWKLV